MSAASSPAQPLPAESTRVSPWLGLLKRIGIRLLWAIPTLIFISFVTFGIAELAPGDAATAIAGEHGNDELVARIRKEMGLDKPFLVRYVDFVSRAMKGDFGRSWYPLGSEDTYVRDILADRSLRSLQMATLAIVLAAFFGVVLGVVAGIWHNRWPDRLAVILSTLGICIPNFVLAPLFILVFALQLDVLPMTWPSVNADQMSFVELLPYLLMPVIILATRPAAVITRLTRAAMIDVLSQDYIRTAKAKGVPFFRLVFHHAFRNCLVPVTTAIGTSFGYLLTGSFIVETAFRVPGLGQKTIDAIYKGDYPIIQAVVLLFAVAFILVNLVVDLVLPMLDPRIREGAA